MSQLEIHQMKDLGKELACRLFTRDMVLRIRSERPWSEAGMKGKPKQGLVDWPAPRANGVLCCQTFQGDL